MRFFLFFTLIITFSCASKKNVILLQDITDSDSFKVEYSVNTIKPDDILKINIFSENPELSIPFNKNLVESNSGLETYKINGYLVDSKGYINFPVLGDIYVKDLTANQVSNLISKNLVEEGLLISPTADVKVINSYFTILGEVNQPGRYNFLENNINLMQAIGISGDLTINGERNNIKILRNVDDKIITSTVDLTSSDIFESDFFQIYSGDIIIVNPNSSRVKNAGIIGNSGTLLSLLSFLLSSLILITNN